MCDNVTDNVFRNHSEIKKNKTFLTNHPAGDGDFSCLNHRQNKNSSREHSDQKNKTLLFPVHSLSCVDIRILQVTVTL